MFILKSMTGAEPETRLVLLAWAARAELNFAAEATDNFESIGVSKLHLSNALEYLVLEGYLLKVKLSSGYKSKPRFHYELTTEAINLWNSTVGKLEFIGELLYVLTSPEKSNLNLPKNLKISTRILRLVWAGLVMQTNSVGYVIGCELETFSKTLGISKSKLLGAIQILNHNGIVENVAVAVSASRIFDSLTSVYKVNPRRSDRRIINLGVCLSSSLNDFRFMSNLYKFRSLVEANTTSDQIFIPPHDSEYLTKEQYYELATIFSCQKLENAIYQRCLSTILVLTPLYAAKLSCSPADSQDDLSEKSFEYLQKIVFEELSKSLLNLQAETNEQNALPENSQSEKEDDLFRTYTINELTRELMSVIQTLSESWNVYAAFPGGSLRLVGYRPHTQMMITPKNCEKLESQAEINDDFFQPTQVNYTSLSFNDVLLVQVQNDVSLGDCLVINGKLITANPTITGAKIQHVESLTCIDRIALNKAKFKT